MIEYSRPLIVIAGPTASGKTGIATRLAKDIDGVIINGDSRQVYKEISIGTARPTAEEMNGVEHFLYGHVSVEEEYNLFRYQNDVKEVLNSLPKEKTPILVGGTGLYIDSVVFNYELTEHTNNTEERLKLYSMTVSELQKEIGEENLEVLNESDRKNKHRLVRFIEKGNRLLTKNKTLNHIYFVLDTPREMLKKRIETRVKDMLERGLLQENEMLREKGLHNLPSLKTIGYQEFDKYFSGEHSIEEVGSEIVRNTTKYAKRQRTWFRRNKDAIWTNNYEEVLVRSQKFAKTS